MTYIIILCRLINCFLQHRWLRVLWTCWNFEKITENKHSVFCYGCTLRVTLNGVWHIRASDVLNFRSSFIVADAIITELLAKKHRSSSVARTTDVISLNAKSLGWKIAYTLYLILARFFRFKISHMLMWTPHLKKIHCFFMSSEYDKDGHLIFLRDLCGYVWLFVTLASDFTILWSLSLQRFQPGNMHQSFSITSIPPGPQDGQHGVRS